jgi:hypothetical protein
VPEKIHIVIAVPFGYVDRGQLVRFIESKFPALEISGAGAITKEKAAVG